MIVNLALLIGDIITILFGKWLNLYYKKRLFDVSKIAKINRKVILEGRKLMANQTMYFYLVGNFVYSIFFCLVGIMFGDVFIRYSIVVSIILMILFCLGYKILMIKVEKNKSNNR